MNLLYDYLINKSIILQKLSKNMMISRILILKNDTNIKQEKLIKEDLKNENKNNKNLKKAIKTSYKYLEHLLGIRNYFNAYFYKTTLEKILTRQAVNLEKINLNQITEFYSIYLYFKFLDSKKKEIMKNDFEEKNNSQKILKKKNNPLKNNNNNEINNNLVCENKEKFFDNINIISNKNFTFNTQIKDQLNNSSLKSSNEENLSNNKEKIDHKLNFNFNFNFPPTPNNFNLLKKKRNKFKENSQNKKKNINLNLNLNLNVNSNSLDITENKAKSLVNKNLNISNKIGLPKILLKHSYGGNNKEDCISIRNDEINNFSNEGNKNTEKKKNILNSEYEKKFSQENLINNKLNLDDEIDLKKINKISAEDYCFDFNLLDVLNIFFNY